MMKGLNQVYGSRIAEKYVNVKEYLTKDIMDMRVISFLVVSTITDTDICSTIMVFSNVV